MADDPRDPVLGRSASGGGGGRPSRTQLNVSARVGSGWVWVGLCLLPAAVPAVHRESVVLPQGPPSLDTSSGEQSLKGITLVRFCKK